MKALDTITKILVIVGGLNWGLVGAANFNLVAAIFGADSALSKVVYVLVGISAVIQAGLAFTTQKSMSTHAAH